MSSRGLRRRLPWIGGGVLILLLFIFTPLNIVFRPLVSVMTVVEAGTFRMTRSVWESVQRLVIGFSRAEELARLRSEAALAKTSAASCAAQTADATSLRAMLGLREQLRAGLVAAQIVGQDPNEPSTTLRLSFSDSRVRPGQAVLDPAGHLVGLIGRVSGSIATVDLLMSRHTKIPVHVAGKSTAFGLLISRDGLALQLTQSPKTEKLAPGDILLTSLGLPGVPANVPTGLVISASSPPEGLWQEAMVSPLTEFASLSIVGIVSE